MYNFLSYSLNDKLPIVSMTILGVISLSNWLASLISGHMSVGVLVNLFYFKSVSKLTIQSLEF